jgi:hypothetical protein
MSRPRGNKPVHLEVAGLVPLPPAMDEWERGFIEPVFARLFDVPKVTTTELKEVRDGERAR